MFRHLNSTCVVLCTAVCCVVAAGNSRYIGFFLQLAHQTVLCCRFAVLQTIEEQFKGTFDFFYLPIDFKNKCNVGYAFINMLKPQYIPPLVARFNNKRWDKFNSEKVRRRLLPCFWKSSAQPATASLPIGSCCLLFWSC
jgi:hypothetical protein